MAKPAKKQFPGIFVVIAISFLVYLTIVTVVIMAHYKKPKPVNDANRIIGASATSTTR